MIPIKSLSAVVIYVLVSFSYCMGSEEGSSSVDLQVTTLSTMVTEFRGIGEWGYAALVEFDGHRILFDTGARPQTVLHNAKELGIDLADVETVVISHNHWDHTGGLVTLRETLKKTNPRAISETHVGKGAFLPRALDPDHMGNLPPMPKEFLVTMLEVGEGYRNAGGTFLIHEVPKELSPGVWVTGPIPRIHPEKNWTPFMRIVQPGTQEEDVIPEDQALILDTPQGVVVVAGCGHAGIVNTMEYARQITNGKAILAVIGGFHLMSASDEAIQWTGEKMREFGVEYIIGAHCTGLNAVTVLRSAAGLGRETAVVGTVGSTFSLETGIDLGLLNR